MAMTRTGPTRDPKRWSDAGGGAPDDVRRLLASGRPARAMTAAEQARAATRVAGLAAAPTGGAAGNGARAGARVPLGVAGAVTAAAVVVGFFAAAPRLRPGRPPAPVTAAAPAGAATAAAVEPAAARDEAAAKEPTTTATAATTARAPAGGAAHRAPGRAAARDDRAGADERGASDGEDALTREQRLLERARALVERDPDAALVELARHGRLFPGGQLTAEKELLRVTALERLGRHREARAAGAALIARAPQSIYVERIRAILRLGPGEAP
jgi:hypothetical protein